MAPPSPPSSSSCFLKALAVSPDGAHVLAAREDHRFVSWVIDERAVHQSKYYFTSDADLRDSSTTAPTNDAPDLFLPLLDVSSGEAVYDFCWYPLMNAGMDPSTCCFLTTCRDHPVQLRDGLTGALRCCYVAHDAKDELEAANSVTFNPSGDKVYCGSTRMIRCFDVANPGKACDEYPTCRSRRDTDGQRGIVSTLQFNPDRSGAYAAGSYAFNINVYVENMEGSALELRDIDFGVTALRWSPCGHMLWAGGRAHDDIVCWDLRHTRAELGRVRRPLASNQRMQFDLDPWGQYLATGTQDGRVLLYDATTFELVADRRHASGECVNTAAFHPFSALLLTCTGQRHFAVESDDSDDSDEDHDGGAGGGTTAKTGSGPCGQARHRPPAPPPGGVQAWAMARTPMLVPSEFADPAGAAAETSSGSGSGSGGAMEQ